MAGKNDAFMKRLLSTFNIEADGHIKNHSGADRAGKRPGTAGESGNHFNGVPRSPQRGADREEGL
jgi:hypothetical protein